MGRWRLTPPWYWGDTACGRETIPVGDTFPRPGARNSPCGGDGGLYAAARRHLIRHGFAAPPVSLRVGPRI